jgi:hypothetical protein
VVQGTAAEWALIWLAEIRHRLRGLPEAATPATASGPFARNAHLAFFLHDEVILHVPAEQADAAASAVRWIDLDSGRVTTAVGSGLFDWGDANGGRDVARLQHPLGLAADMHGTLYVADSYNGMIRLLSRRSGELRRLRLDYRLDEPHALALSGGLLWIANTNLHEIACVDLGAGSVRRVPVAEG